LSLRRARKRSPSDLVDAEEIRCSSALPLLASRRSSRARSRSLVRLPVADLPAHEHSNDALERGLPAAPEARPDRPIWPGPGCVRGKPSEIMSGAWRRRACGGGCGRPRSRLRAPPPGGTLYQVVRDNLETLYGAVDDGTVKMALPRFVRKEVEGYLERGTLRLGSRGYGATTARRRAWWPSRARAADLPVVPREADERDGGQRRRVRPTRARRPDRRFCAGHFRP